MRRDSTGSFALALVAILLAHALSPVLADVVQRAVDARNIRPAAKVARRLERRAERHARRDARRQQAPFAIEEPPALPTPEKGKDGKELSDFDLRFAAYKGLGSWVDVFDRGPWKHPTRTVERMRQRGVRTLYVQTSSYGSTRRIVYPKKLAGFVRAGHDNGIKIVGWSVPSFRHPYEDFLRARAAIKFETEDGDQIDSFALDIEAAIVPALWKRNRRLLKMAEKLRNRVGDDYPLGAITPDPGHALYWPKFPYKRVANRFDVIVPMGYFTFRTKGYKGAHAYTTAGIRFIRRATAQSEIPIHFIGGIADDVGTPAAKGFVRALRERRVIGGSLYDFPITKPKTWRELRRVPRG